MFDTAIITAPRKIGYLSLMLDSFFETWPQMPRPHVFAEPVLGEYSHRSFYNEERVHLHMNDATLGVVHNWLSAAHWLLANGEQPFIMMCEDDIEFQPQASEKILNLLVMSAGVNCAAKRFLNEKIGVISPYCAEICADGRDWHKPNLRKGGWCGALCTIYSRAMLENLLAAEDVFHTFAQGKHLDYAIGATVTKHLGLSVFTHAPTLVLHMGEYSTTASNNTDVNRYHESRMPAR